MSRLIDADHVLKALSGFNDYEHGNWHFLSGIETAREIIDDAPTVEPKHGYWLFNGRPVEKWSHGNYCSVCGEYSETCGNYCPECGAEMEDVEDE